MRPWVLSLGGRQPTQAIRPGHLSAGQYAAGNHQPAVARRGIRPRPCVPVARLADHFVTQMLRQGDSAVFKRCEQYEAALENISKLSLKDLAGRMALGARSSGG